MDLQQYLADISLKTMSQLHRAIAHRTGGQVLGSAFGMPVAGLHTVGRKPGQPRSTMLTAPVIDGDRVVLVASKGGDDRDPDWYRNLIAHPDIELTHPVIPQRVRRLALHLAGMRLGPFGRGCQRRDIRRRVGYCRVAMARKRHSASS
jgi:hypothetical protein